MMLRDLAIVEMPDNGEQHELLEFSFGALQSVDDEFLVLCTKMSGVFGVEIDEAFGAKVLEIDEFAFVQTTQRVGIQPRGGDRTKEFPHDLAVGFVIHF